MTPHHSPALHPAPAPAAGLRVGVDTVEIADVAASLRHFGRRFTHRLFTAGERDYALAVPALAAQRLAARFAAKEAAIKALNLGERGVDWRDFEVQRSDDGSCRLALHGRAAARLAELPPCDTALSLSHDQAHAVAVVVLLPRAIQR
jgi:holo-[acyl-carrier protein] synthase